MKRGALICLIANGKVHMIVEHDGVNRMNFYGCIWRWRRYPGWRRYLLWEPERETHTRRRKPTLTCVWDVEGLKDTICRCVFSHRLKTVAGDVPYNQFTLYSSFTVVLPHNTCQVNITQHILLHRRMKIQDDTHQVGDSKIPSSCPWEGKSGSSQHKQGWQEAKHHFCICLFTVFFRIWAVSLWQNQK